MLLQIFTALTGQLMAASRVWYLGNSVQCFHGGQLGRYGRGREDPHFLSSDPSQCDRSLARGGDNQARRSRPLANEH